MRDSFTKEYFNWKFNKVDIKQAIVINGRALLTTEIAQLVGAIDGSYIATYRSDQEGLYNATEIFIESSLHESIRTVYELDSGEYAMRNEILSVKKEMQGKGLGRRILGYQVETARKLGFKHISTHAMRYKGYNGYYTWPILGFNGKLPNGFLDKVPKNLNFVKDVQELIGYPEGYQLWKDEGVNIKLVFELNKDSVCSMTLENYLKKKGVVLWD